MSTARGPHSVSLLERWRAAALAAEDRRIAISATLALIVAVADTMVFTSRDARALGLTVLTGWIAFSGSHALMVWSAHRGLSGESLRQFVLTDTEAIRGRSLWHDLLLGTSNRAMSSSIAAGALLGVGVLVAYPDLRRDPVMLGLGAALVAVAWADLAITNAVHYARLDHAYGGLEFPGDEQRSFADYQYFSTAVMSTFGATDITIVTSRMRTAVRHHGVLAFCFNSVIVALLVSLVLSLN